MPDEARPVYIGVDYGRDGDSSVEVEMRHDADGGFTMLSMKEKINDRSAETAIRGADGVYRLDPLSKEKR